MDKLLRSSTHRVYLPDYISQPYIFAVCLFFCLLPGITSFLLVPFIPQWVTVSGYMIQLYKLTVSFYLFFMAVRWSLSSRQAFWLLTANSVFAAGIFRDYLTAELYEPIYGLWQTEYTAFFLVLIFMVMVISQYHLLVVENTRLTCHLKDEIDKKTGYLTVLLNERRQLLSSIAHDMKAPIAVIQAYIDLIHTGNVQIDDATDEYISMISRKSSALAEQIATLQTFQEDASETEPPEKCSLAEFLREVRNETEMYAEAKGICFHSEIPECTASLLVQRSRLLHAMENIILNATEYTPYEGVITLSCRLAGDQAVITIRDTGCGITADDLPHIFEFQFSGKSESEKNGIVRGVGLYFARAAVLEHGGTVQVQSEPGHGTEFTVTLPISDYE